MPRLLLACLMLLFPGLLQAQVYRCVNDEGVTIFSNIGCPEDAAGGTITVPENITIIDNSNIRKKIIERERLDADTDLRDFRVDVPAEKKKQEAVAEPEQVYRLDMDRCREALRDMKTASSVAIENRNPVQLDALKYISNMYCGKHHHSSEDFEQLYSDDCEAAVKKLRKLSERTRDQVLLTTEKISADLACLPP